MKLKPLDPVIDQPTTIEDVSVLITHVGRALNGLPRVRATAWNGRPLAADVLELDRATDRRRFAKAASKADPATIPDPAPIEAALLECSEALNAQLAPADDSADVEEGVVAHRPASPAWSRSCSTMTEIPPS